MSEGIEASQNDIDIARNGIMLQLGTVPAAKKNSFGVNGFVAETGMAGFISTQAEVQANLYARVRQLEKVLHQGISGT